jgi:hypothetical protein
MLGKNPAANRLAMTKPSALWRQLKVGDKIRLTEVPREFFQKGYHIHRDTLRVYRILVARRRPLRIWMIDEYRQPWIQCRFRRNDGHWEYHSLAVNHSGLARVKPRRANP